MSLSNTAGRRDRAIDCLPWPAISLARPAAVIAAGGVQAALAAKAATTTIPIVFEGGADPVELGLVTSLNGPGGNITGVSNFSTVLVAKQIELLRETVPNSAVISVLVNPTSPNLTQFTARDAQAAGRSLGTQINILNASTKDQIDTAFASFARERPDAMLIGADAFFSAVAFNLLRWRRAMAYQPFIMLASFPRLAA